MAFGLELRSGDNKIQLNENSGRLFKIHSVTTVSYSNSNPINISAIGCRDDGEWYAFELKNQNSGIYITYGTDFYTINHSVTVSPLGAPYSATFILLKK